MPRIPPTYVPESLSASDKKTQLADILDARALYKKGEYKARTSLKSFVSAPSKHVAHALAQYGVSSMAPSRALTIASGCSIKGQREIVAKGEGAYYSSGSRPNQSAASWGLARLASSLTGGPASVVDLHILEKECKPESIALKMAKATKSANAKV
jgi:hypothetical protein